MIGCSLSSILQTIRECLAAGCDRQLLVKMFRNTMALMGRRRNGEQHEHLYFKFQNSKQVLYIIELEASIVHYTYGT